MLAWNQMELHCYLQKIVDQNGEREGERVTFWARETLGAGTPTEKSVKHVWPLVGKHLHPANENELCSWDSESIRSVVNSGPPGVSGVAGTETGVVGVPVSNSAIHPFFLFSFCLKIQKYYVIKEI